MLWTLLLILLVMWALGLGFGVGGSLIHLVLVVALVVLVVNVLQGAEWPSRARSQGTFWIRRSWPRLDESMSTRKNAPSTALPAMRDRLIEWLKPSEECELCRFGYSSAMPAVRRFMPPKNGVMTGGRSALTGTRPAASKILELTPTDPGHSAKSKGGSRRTAIEPDTTPSRLRWSISHSNSPTCWPPGQSKGASIPWFWWRPRIFLGTTAAPPVGRNRKEARHRSPQRLHVCRRSMTLVDVWKTRCFAEPNT